MKIKKYNNTYIVELEQGDRKAGKSFYGVIFSLVMVFLTRFIGEVLLSSPPSTAENTTALYNALQELFSIIQLVIIVLFLWQLTMYVLINNYVPRDELEIRDIIKAIERGGDFIYFKNNEVKIVKFEKEKVKHVTTLDDGRFIIETEPLVDSSYA